MDLKNDPRLLIGFEQADDAGVYKISDDLALVQTMDFFTPIVDDPFTFGQVAACNALSDVYAMGATPLTAMNIVCFPSKQMDLSVLTEVIKGGYSIIQQAGALLVGGHSLDDPEIKYGLSLTGRVHPEKVVTNAGARPGDALYITKPIGTGIITTALKAGKASARAADAATKAMATLNKEAAEAMVAAGAHACTDVTGFGLIGHLSEIMCASRVACRISGAAVPLLPEVVELAKGGFIPGGTKRNRDFYGKWVDPGSSIDPDLATTLYDAQTSGGLLIACPEDREQDLVDRLKKANCLASARIGTVTKAGKYKVTIKK